jgi:hypothetical protein
MEELLVLLLGAGVVLALPLVPALRPAVKSAVKGGLVVAGTTKAAAAAASHHWKEIVHEAKDEMHGVEAQGIEIRDAESQGAETVVEQTAPSA